MRPARRSSFPLAGAAVKVDCLYPELYKMGQSASQPASKKSARQQQQHPMKKSLPAWHRQAFLRGKKASRECRGNEQRHPSLIGWPERSNKCAPLPVRATSVCCESVCACVCDVFFSRHRLCERYRNNETVGERERERVCECECVTIISRFGHR